MVPTEYMFWRFTFEDVLHLNGLYEIVSSNEIPPKTLGTGTLNPTYTEWAQKNLYGEMD